MKGNDFREVPVSRNLSETSFPGIAAMNALAEKQRRRGRTLVNLGQAVPYFSPPENAIERLKRDLADGGVHRYTLDPGLPSLRQATCGFLRSRFGINVDPEREILITAGANGAYLMAVMALLNPGDIMGILTPWYFNHAMAVRLVGGTVLEIPLTPASGFSLDPPLILERLRAGGAKALTIVNSNNPTGATYSPEALEELVRGAVRAGMAVVMDETYSCFPTTGGRHFSPGSLEKRPSSVITIGSFSKTFALTGWRVGYLAASAPLISEMLKIQDTMVICAPHPGQRLALGCLESDVDSWLAPIVGALGKRRETFLAAFPPDGAWKTRSCGLFFAFLEGNCNGREAAGKLLENHGVITIPGDVFGAGLENTLRVSIGCVPEDSFADGIAILKAGLS